MQALAERPTNLPTEGEQDVDTVYTPQEVADALKLKVETIYGYIREGKLRAARFGNRYRVTESDLKAFIERAVAGELAEEGAPEEEAQDAG